MSNWIGPTVKQLWNFAMHVLHNFFGFSINTTTFCLGRSSYSSPSTKELHAWTMASWLGDGHALGCATTGAPYLPIHTVVWFESHKNPSLRSFALFESLFFLEQKKLNLFVGCKPRLAPMKITFEPVPLTAWLISCSMSTLKYIF